VEEMARRQFRKVLVEMILPTVIETIERKTHSQSRCPYKLPFQPQQMHGTVDWQNHAFVGTPHVRESIESPTVSAMRGEI
jgi:hypothetical protein